MSIGELAKTSQLEPGPPVRARLSEEIMAGRDHMEKFRECHLNYVRKSVSERNKIRKT